MSQAFAIINRVKINDNKAHANNEGLNGSVDWHDFNAWLSPEN